MNHAALESIAKDLVSPGRGILAADESTSTIGKRLAGIGVENTEDNRRAYRELLFTAPELGQYISGVICYDETIRQKASDGRSMVEIMQKANMIPGIKVDTGAHGLPFSAGEKVTEGLDGLRDRLKEYHNIGARFAKWRAVITIGQGLPSENCLLVNAHALARYAALCQEAGIVPIVEPEVLMDGDHDIEHCYRVTSEALHQVFRALHQQRVHLEGMLLKPNMVVPGAECPRQADIQTTAEFTLRCLQRNVPSAVPGIVFLSGGQSDEKATAHLDAMNKLATALPWALSFSYGRALQAPTLKAWGGVAAQVAAAQKALVHRARLNSAAAKGEYSAAMEKAA